MSFIYKCTKLSNECHCKVASSGGARVAYKLFNIIEVVRNTELFVYCASFKTKFSLCP